MNEVFSNPLYIRDLNEVTDKIKHFQYMNPPLQAYKIIRDFVSQCINEPAFKERIKCGSVSNCSFCCHDKIDMGRVEAEHIKSIIKERKLIPNKHRIDAQNSFAPIKWVDKACPMLLDENENGQRLCSIYEDRPIICMIHNSASDPENCNKEFDPNKTTQTGRSGAIDALYFASVKLGHKEIDTDTVLVPMHQALKEMEF